MITAKVKEWGNSIGVIIPKEEVERLNLHAGDEILLDVEKKGNALKEIWGLGKESKIPTETILKEIRKNESKYW